MARFTINLPFLKDKKTNEVKSEFVQSDRSGSSTWGGMVGFNGEKTPLTLGTPLNFKVNYYETRQRAWENYLMSDYVQNIIDKSVRWFIGRGLSLQADPDVKILQKYNISLDKKAFTDDIERNFYVFADSKYCDHSELQNLHDLACEALKNAMLSGDVLCVLRLVNGQPTVQLIDGCYVQTPMDKLTDFSIVNGVKIGKNNEHIGFYVVNKLGNYEYIESKNSFGQKVAWLFSWRKYKIQDVRGMSLLTAVMETVSIIDRYKTATLSTAEQNSNIVYSFEHDANSSGENPDLNQIKQSAGKGNLTAPETENDQINNVATKIAQTTKNRAYNLPVGVKLKRHEADADPNFGEFLSPNLDIVCATMGIPKEVALDKYEGSYSSSRASLKSWEHSILIARERCKNFFYKPIYEFWLDLYILQNNISVSGYIQAFRKKDTKILNVFRLCNFIGVSVPHIDPLKEVMAERKKLGTNFDHIPLTTAEKSCINLSTGDFEENILRAEEEITISDNFKPIVKNEATGDTGTL